MTGGRLNWSRISSRDRMHRKGVEDIKGKAPLVDRRAHGLIGADMRIAEDANAGHDDLHRTRIRWHTSAARMAHTLRISVQRIEPLNVCQDLKLSFLLGCKLDLHQSAKLNISFSFVDFCGAATIMLQLNIASFH